jgi:hypothetical protein
MNKTVKILLIVGGVATLGIGGYILYKKYKKDDTEDDNKLRRVTSEAKKINKIAFNR